MKTPPPPPPQGLIAKEAARELGVSLRTFNRWVKSGEITAQHQLPGITGTRLFSRDDIERLRTRRTAA